MHLDHSAGLENNAGIATFRLAPRHGCGQSLQSTLRQQGVSIEASTHTVRLSLHLSNTAEDIETLTRKVAAYVQ
jgi:selenocysteine lyase/cysteine desulfurase